MAKAKQHGGKRDGAGRPPSSPEGPTITIAASVPGVLVERLDAMAKAEGWNRSEAVTHAIRGLVGSPKRNAKG
jgi:hypothetical protein